MNTNDNLYPSTSGELIKNFSDMIKNFSNREEKWKQYKEEYESKISELSCQLDANYTINSDLLKKIKMLEYEIIRQRESKRSETNKDEILYKDSRYKNIIKEDEFNLLDDKNLSLLNMLKNIGINERLANNLFIDFDLNKPELENMIKKDIEQKFLESDNTNTLNKNKKIDNTNNNIKLHKFIELKSHFDEVRKLSYIENNNNLISVSEDCLIKVWSLNNILYNSQSEDVKPYLNLRGHTGPLFCIEHGHENLIYTAGSGGIIQIWNIPSINEIKNFSTNDEINNLNIGIFQKNEDNEIYWDLKHHPKEKLLVSLSSSADISFWETASCEEFINSFNNGKFKWFKSTKTKKSSYINDQKAIPTICEFMKQNNNQLILGFNDVTISLLDLNKNSFISHYNLFNNNNLKTNKQINNRVLFQPNCFAIYNTIPSMYIGFEDGNIKLIDFRNNIPSLIITNHYSKEIISNNIKAHDDSVTSLNLYNEIYLISTSHDSKIKLWDVRKINEPISYINTEQKKWNESIWDSILIEKSLTLCVACADSSIKLYKL